MVRGRGEERRKLGKEKNRGEKWERRKSGGEGNREERINIGVEKR